MTTTPPSSNNSNNSDYSDYHHYNNNTMSSLIDSPFDHHLSLLLPSSTDKPPSKKPRHRHSQAQLAALNQLYEKSEHPSLEERSSLADALRMETKTVNAWFQNKRASLKKRTRTTHPTSSSLSSSPIVLASTASTSLRSRRGDLDEFHEYDPLRHHPAPHSMSILHPPATPPPPSDAFVDPEATPRRFRPSPDQTEELRKLYNATAHPSREEREELCARIGMRYQSITNWFQNQRSMAKKRKEDEPASLPLDLPEPRTSVIEFRSSAPPPASTHPSLTLTMPSSSLTTATTNHHSLSPPKTRWSAGASLPFSSPDSEHPLPLRRSTPRRNSAPYGTVAAIGTATATLPRARRTRPEPYQLDALRKLYSRTSNPSIEDRTLLALEIGMDVSRVTNWFRNLRQTSRKRARKTGQAVMVEDEEEEDPFIPESRPVTPSLPSSSSSTNGEHMDVSHVDGDDRGFSDGASDEEDDDDEEEYQEAVTPVESSPSPRLLFPTTTIAHLSSSSSSSSSSSGFLGHGNGLDPHPHPHPHQPHLAASYAELDKIASAHPGVRIEDALLLLSFALH